MGSRDKSDSEFAQCLQARAPARSASTGPPGTPGRILVAIPAFEDDDTAQTVILETETGLARLGTPVRLLLDDPGQYLDGLIWDATVCAQNRVKVTFYANTEGDRPAVTVRMKIEPYPRPLFLGVKLDDLPKEIF